MEEILVEAAKGVLAVTTDDEDVAREIEDLVAAAIADLASAGVVQVAEPTPAPPAGNPAGEQVRPLYKRAVMLYCKGHFRANPDADKYLARYTSTKTTMSLDRMYRAPEEEV